MLAAFGKHTMQSTMQSSPDFNDTTVPRGGNNATAYACLEQSQLLKTENEFLPAWYMSQAFDLESN